MIHLTEAVHGHVEPGFESVRDLFEERVSDLGRGGGAYCAYLDGRSVVDLWAGLADAGVRWRENTLSLLVSATKGLAALCVQILYERQLIRLDAPVAHYWPEFGSNGKQEVLVRHVLTHSAGLIGLADHESVLGVDGYGWNRYADIAGRLAAARPVWPPGSKHGYHAITYGWLVGELVRRVDGRTIGAFFNEEIANPLRLQLWIGTPPQQQRRVAGIVRGTSTPAGEDAAQRSDPSTLLGQACLAAHGTNVLDELPSLSRSAAFLAAEQAGINGTGTARSLAKLYALLARGGELDSVRLLSPKTVDAFGEIQHSGLDAVVRRPMARALGYHRSAVPSGILGPLGPGERTFGHAGAGGQVGFCDPANRLSVGFLRNDLSFSGPLGPDLHEALYASLP